MAQANEGGEGGAEASAQRQDEAQFITSRQTISEANSCHSNQGGYFSKPENWVSLLTLIAVSIYTGITALMWCNSTRQLSTVIEGNKISREAFTSVQRAFVTVSSFDTPLRMSDLPGHPGEQFKSWWFIPNIRNSGNTPTKNMRYFIGATCPQEFTVGMAGHMTIECDFTRRDLLDPVDIFNKPPSKGDESSAILGPQSSIALGGVGINERSLQAIRKGFRMYVFGLVYYNDIFARTDRHTTKFCYQIGANLSDKNEIVSSFGLCDHWNCSDDECADDRKAWEADVASGKIQKPFEIPAGATPFSTPIPVTPTPTPAEPQQPIQPPAPK